MIVVRDKFIWIERPGVEPQKILPESEFTEEAALEICQFLGGLHPLFGENSFSLDSVYEPFFRFDSKASSDVVLFPGSFSPWHKGHEACALGHQKGPVVIIPDFNPWKEVRSNSTWAELVSLWQFALNRRGVSLFVGFLAMKVKNPTVSWLPKLPIKNKWLLMGDDSFLSLHKWQDIEKLLLGLRGLLVCPRKGLKNELSAQANSLQTERPITIEFLAAHSYQDLSSSEIRGDGQTQK